MDANGWGFQATLKSRAAVWLLDQSQGVRENAKSADYTSNITSQIQLLVPSARARKLQIHLKTGETISQKKRPPATSFLFSWLFLWDWSIVLPAVWCVQYTINTDDGCFLGFEKWKMKKKWLYKGNRWGMLSHQNQIFTCALYKRTFFFGSRLWQIRDWINMFQLVSFACLVGCFFFVCKLALAILINLIPNLRQTFEISTCSMHECLLKSVHAAVSARCQPRPSVTV